MAARPYAAATLIESELPLSFAVDVLEVTHIVNADELDPKPAEPVSATVGMESARSRDEVREVAAPRRSGAGLSVLLAAVALAAAAWMWWQQQQQATQLQVQQQQYQAELQRLEQALASVKESTSQQSSSQITAQISDLGGDLQQRLRALEATQTANENFRSESSAWTRSAQSALEETQSRLNGVDERLRTLTARSAQSDSELELEEIDYLLRMAQERLQLFGDTRNADRALQLADHQVVAFDNPMFITLRREIAAARQALAATDVPDMAALSAELDKVQDSLVSLPYKTSEYEPAVQSGSESAELSWWQRLKNSLSGLITVRRVADDGLALPALADQQALRQRAWLQIEQARLAALSREQEIYHNALMQAEATITRWFAADDAQVRLSLSGLQALQQRNVNPPMPDISAPWNTLRSIRDAGLSPTVAPTENPIEAPTPAPAVATPPETFSRSRSQVPAGDEAANGTDGEAAEEANEEPVDAATEVLEVESGIDAAADITTTDDPAESDQ